MSEPYVELRFTLRGTSRMPTDKEMSVKDLVEIRVIAIVDEIKDMPAVKMGAVPMGSTLPMRLAKCTQLDAEIVEVRPYNPGI